MHILIISWIISLLLYGCTKNEFEVIAPPQESYDRKEDVFLPEEEAKASQKGSKDLVSLSQERNPFLTYEEEEFFEKEMKEEIDYLTLSGVFYSSGVSYAIIDGRIVKEKDIIDNKEVVKIGREEVILKDSQDKEYVVKVKKIINED